MYLRMVSIFSKSVLFVPDTLQLPLYCYRSEQVYQLAQHYRELYSENLPITQPLCLPHTLRLLPTHSPVIYRQ